MAEEEVDRVDPVTGVDRRTGRAVQPPLRPPPTPNTTEIRTGGGGGSGLVWAVFGILAGVITIINLLGGEPIRLISGCP